MISIRTVEHVLSSSSLIIDIPNYVNGRSTAINAEMIKTSIWIYKKGLMDCNEIHRGLNSYETLAKSSGTEILNLSDKIIKDSLRTIGKIIPTPMFTMWCKKCWSFIDSAVLLSKSNNGPK
jgi:hypothetical protein